MDVFDVNEERIGTVHEVYDASGAEKSTSGGGYLHVPTGFLGLGTEHHIPFSAIRDVRDGRIHLSVAKDRLDEMGYDAAPTQAKDEFDGNTIERTTTTAAQAAMPVAQAPGPRTGEDGARKLQLREEELIARKRSVETGTVGIRTEVVSEQRTLEVPVTREEVTIERQRGRKGRGGSDQRDELSRCTMPPAVSACRVRYMTVSDCSPCPATRMSVSISCGLSSSGRRMSRSE